ncbi:MAG: formyltetrahydrofolate deformylase [Labilithrix sp.]|nr:formyltetrahydrofolate deformylase [Labilithrix sp.]MCW5832144.1 formyltetrahydrofolate deformylase [Labilithrix sp.]
MSRATILFSAPDRPGLVARLSGFFYELGLNILEASNYTDLHGERGARFYMRVVVDLAGLAAPQAHDKLGGSATRSAMEAAFAERIAAPLEGEWSVGYEDRVARVCVMVTKDPTCLYDLALRQKQGELPCEIALVVSNHPTLESAAQSFRLPFYALPVTKETKPEQEARVLELLKRHDVDLVVLARYMQVLSDGFLRDAPPVINIHHGFLPAFQGAKPYHQAHARGVKLIGATAHYATKDLDEGPIIEQDVERITHALGPDDLVRVGRDVERVVLARAVRAHLERRVIVEGRRTFVL